ncbi:hypothetical protein CGLAR1_09965 [Corynebacterium glutamicum]|uniref:hypothetical protein n=1 Tax=Corynebacterium glutamicum TaxID=1718 RepID=UPI0004F8B566|nr:hypothetical protein [Corynebacterium glutamicum]AIK85565.1 hypothetical protein CGLAR1_09965 [Corynebacterium glutamicum]AIK88350.1 hypothetical protein AR0_10115 [Corynebacterium glutamicum]
MSLRRSTLTLVTASAVALSVFTPVAQAQSSDALTQLSDNITSSQILDDDGNPVDGNETWPGSSEGSSMLSSGDIPAAPSLSSSGKDTSDDDDEISEEQQALIDRLSEMPVIGSIVSPPEWIAIPFAVLQGLLAITTLASTAASFMVTVDPSFKQTLRDMLTQFGINVDA